MNISPRELSNDEVKLLLEKIQKVQTKNVLASKAKSELLRPGFKFTENESFILIDSALLKSELSQTLGGIILKLSQELQAPIRLIDLEYEFDDDQELDQFLTGLLISLDVEKTYLPTLRVEKKPFELGKATGFFLRVRGEVLRGGYQSVGLHGLKTSHRFFGNDSTRATTEKERSERRSPLETYLQRMFARIQGASDRYRDYLDLIQSLLQHYRLSKFEDEDVKKIIDHYQKGFDEVRVQFERPIYSVKKTSKGKVQTGTRRPKRPNSSPTLLNIEFKDFVSPLIDSHWQSLEDHKKNFKENVRNLGYSHACAIIRDVYDARFEVTRNFSNLTTRRLQEARVLNLLPANARKVDFDDEVRKKLFELRFVDKRVFTFVDELKKLIPERYRYGALRIFLRGNPGVENMTPDQLVSLLADKVAMSYSRVNIGIGTYKFSDIKLTAERERTVRQIVDKISKTVVMSKTIPERLISLQRAVFTRKQEVRKLQNFTLLKTEIDALTHLLEADFWTNSLSGEIWKSCFACETNIKSLEFFRKETLRILQTAAEEVKKGLSARDLKIVRPAEDANAAIDEIISKLRAITIA